MSHPTQMSAADTGLLVIDVQEKLMVKIPGAATLVRDVAFLIDAARLLDMPVQATEQYPKGLGPTVAELAPPRSRQPWRQDCTFEPAARCRASSTPSAGRHGRRSSWPGSRRTSASSILPSTCSPSTSRSILPPTPSPVAIPSTASSHCADWNGPVQFSRQSETCVFEWVGGSGHPRFKALSALVQQRMEAIQP